MMLLEAQQRVKPAHRRTPVLAAVLTVLSVPACTAPPSPASTLGSADAAVVVEEFGDYQCGPCARFGRNLHRALARQRGEVRLIYHHCPSRQHPVGRLAAMVAIGAGGRFWELHWELVERGPIQTEEQLWEVCRSLGLEVERLQDQARAGRNEAALERELELADRRRIRGTPTTFVNNRRVEGAVSARQLGLILEPAARGGSEQ